MMGMFFLSMIEKKDIIQSLWDIFFWTLIFGTIGHGTIGN